jgi:DsbC/DsbD-like thiol-disulfide interchange protein
MASGLPLAGLAALVAVLAQSPASPPWLKPATHASAAVSIEPGRKGTPPGEVVLAIDVTPAPGIHVYAPGNEDYIPVTVSVDPAPAVKPGAPHYPASEPFVFGESKEILRVYAKPFRVTQPITVTGGRAQGIRVTGALRYQACTDKVCFPPESLPIDVVLPPLGR